MKNHKEYKKRCLDLFQNFLNNPTDKDNLINGLKAIETELSKNKKTDKNLWFLAYTSATTVITIKDIEKDLEYNHMPNYKHLVGCFQISIDSKELQIYFS